MRPLFFFFLMIRRPPRSTLFPTRRSSDLMRHAGRVLTRTQIVDAVWRYDLDALSNVVDIYIHYLRDKIDQGFTHPLIKTRSEEHTSELQSRLHLVCRLLLANKKHLHEMIS